jgi:hypothetical protein
VCQFCHLCREANDYDEWKDDSATDSDEDTAPTACSSADIESAIPEGRHLQLVTRGGSVKLVGTRKAGSRARGELSDDEDDFLFPSKANTR